MDTQNLPAKNSSNFAGRTSRAALEPLRQQVLLDKQLTAFLDAIPDFALIINRQREVLAANSSLLETFGIVDIEQQIGKRSGEILGCIFSSKGPDGCGTTIHCSTCGALKSIVRSQELNIRTVSECHVTLDTGVALDLQVVSTPAPIEGLPLTLCILKDISAEKRRSVLEKVFFHDVMNTVGSIRNIATLLTQTDILAPETEMKYRQWIGDLSEKLVDEISHQRKLVAAEQGEFRPSMGMIFVADLMQEVYRLYASHDAADGRNLVLGEIPDCKIVSDAAILRRILGNLVKNALEATETGGTVTMYGKVSADTVTFCVHNQGEIPHDVQLQLFQRSFSTKGNDGRGIGTYSVKLFGEKFLKGKVSFVSREPEGTTFSFVLAKGIPEEVSD